MNWTERLKRDLEGEGATVEPREPRGLVVTSYQGRGDDEVPVLELALSEADIHSYLRGMKSSAAKAFPGTKPMQAAYQLFLVHIMEFVDTTQHKRLWLELIGDELEASATPPYTEEDHSEEETLSDRSGDGPYYWSAYPPEGYREDQAEGTTRQ